MQIWIYWLIDMVESPAPSRSYTRYEPPNVWTIGLTLLFVLCVCVVAWHALLSYAPHGELIRHVLADVRKQ